MNGDAEDRPRRLREVRSRAYPGHREERHAESRPRWENPHLGLRDTESRPIECQLASPVVHR